MTDYQWEQAEKHNPWGKKRVRGSHCAKGHEFTEDNTFIRPFDNARVCRECRKQYAREKYQINKVKNNGVARPRKDRPAVFEVFESSLVPEAALDSWAALQDGLKENISNCVDKPELWADKSIEVSVDQAEEMCYACPVFQLCHDYAVAAQVNAGIWAGLHYDEDDGSIFQEEDF